jgi:hypothetical protein
MTVHRHGWDVRSRVPHIWRHHRQMWEFKHHPAPGARVDAPGVRTKSLSPRPASSRNRQPISSASRSPSVASSSTTGPASSPTSSAMPHARHRPRTHPPRQAPDPREGGTLHPASPREWAYARRYENSPERLDKLMPSTHKYEWNRPHESLGHKPSNIKSRLHAPADTPQLARRCIPQTKSARPKGRAVSNPTKDPYQRPHDRLM